MIESVTILGTPGNHCTVCGCYSIAPEVRHYVWCSRWGQREAISQPAMRFPLDILERIEAERFRK